jgi:mannose-6-phosphate isomerase-like protein (cupin superfamily)
MFTTIMNRPEVRILRVEIQPGAVRRVHTHEDVTFHLLMPLSGPLQVTAGTETVEAKVGQAYFMLKSMPHSFTNTGKTPVLVMETFVKPEPKPAAGGNAADATLAMVIAALGEVSR